MDFIFSHIKGQKPTLLFRCGDMVGGHDLFPLVFLFRRGGLYEKRATKISKSVILKHYCKLA